MPTDDHLRRGYGATMLRIALGGAVGTGLRLVVLGFALSATPSAALRLLAVNVVGAGLLGWVLARPPVPPRWMPALTVGVLGGLTTFSTMVVQAGMLGHAQGLVVAGSGRMTGAGLALVAALLVAHVVLGTGALLTARRVAGRSSR